jgi:hypothetical protein
LTFLVKKLLAELNISNESSNDGYLSQDSIELLGDFNLGLPIKSQILALEIEKALFFGNAVITFIHCLITAKLNGIKKIYHPNFIWLSSVFSIYGIEVRPKGMHQNLKEPRLSSNFLYLKLLKKLFIFDESLFYKTISEVKFNFKLNFHESCAKDDVLFIHFRSGDFFKGQYLRPNYGQPPLKFYTTILKEYSWSKVFLVYEDRLNPLISILESYLESIDLPFQHSSQDVISDINVLLTAKNLIMSRGTFSSVISCISDSLNKGGFNYEVQL